MDPPDFFLPIQKRQTAHRPARKTGADNNETGGFEIKRASEFSDHACQIHLSILRFSFFFLSLFPPSPPPLLFFISKKWSTTFSLTRSGEIDRDDGREEIPRKWSRCEIDRTKRKGKSMTVFMKNVYIDNKFINKQLRDWNSVRILMEWRISIIDRWTEEKKKGTILRLFWNWKLSIVFSIVPLLLLLFVATFKYILLQIREIKKLLQDYPEYFNKYFIKLNQMDLKTLGIFEIA